MIDDNITLNCTFTGYLPNNYQVTWSGPDGNQLNATFASSYTYVTDTGQSQRGGTTVQGAIQSVLNISSIEERDYGSYVCSMVGTTLKGKIILQDTVVISSILGKKLTLS